METAAILVHSLNRFSLCTKMAAVAVAKLLLCRDIICKRSIQKNYTYRLGSAHEILYFCDRSLNVLENKNNSIIFKYWCYKNRRLQCRISTTSAALSTKSMLSYTLHYQNVAYNIAIP